MSTFASVISLVLFAAQAGATSTALEPPQPIVANDVQIDVLREGEACPWLGDFDGDGLNDLLVGEAFGGRLRIYRNLGTKQEPKFGDYDWFRAEGNVARVPWALGGYKGFTPQLVDLDGDGKTDIVSGSYDAYAGWLNEFYWFRRNDGTNFAAAAKLVGVDGKPIQFHGGAHPNFADWDGDGDFDLIVGKLEGEVLLLKNEGSRAEARFASPLPVLAGGKPIQVASKYAHACVADWDGDSKVDLLIGGLDGSVVLYLNKGSSSEPKFDSSLTLVEKSPEPERGAKKSPKVRPAMQPALCVADFNGDGRLDLILGDGSGRHEHVMINPSPKEAKESEKNHEKLAELRRQWSSSFQEYREATKGLKNAGPAGSAEKSKRPAAAIKSDLVAINERIAPAQVDVEYDWPRNHMHGRVWVFLRKPTGSK